MVLAVWGAAVAGRATYELARRVARQRRTGSDIGPLPPDARAVDVIDGTLIASNTFVILLLPLPERRTMSERDKRSIETVQTAASSVVLSRCASELALRLNAHEYLMHGHTTDRRQRLVVSRTHHTHVTSAWHHVHSSLRRTERSRRTTWSKCVSALRSTQGSRGHAMRARERALLRDHPGELRPAVRRAPAQEAAASAAWHPGRPFERPLQTVSERQFLGELPFPGRNRL